MSFDGLPFPALWVPEFDGVVPTGRGKYLTIGAKTDTIDSSAMPFEGLQFPAI
jgi:hypothetical protein